MQAFPIPPIKLKYRELNQESLFQCPNLFDSIPIHSIHIFIPGSSAHKEKYEDILSSDENIYFMIKEATAKCLIESSFLKHFIRNGSLSAVSQNTKVNRENVLSIIPPGKLVLSLERSIAESLSLQKEKSPKKKKRKASFQTIIIDVSYPEFCPGRKVYESVYNELSKIDHIKFSLLLKWKPNGDICPRSLKTYFENQGFECIAYQPNRKYSSKISVPVPKINSNSFDEDICEDFLEWIGTEICDIEYSQSEDYLSKFTIPEEFDVINRLHKYSFQGFYSKHEAISLIKGIGEIFESESELPFITLCFSGYQDSYIAASDFQCFSSCDKLICLVVFPSSNYWLITLNVR